MRTALCIYIDFGTFWIFQRVVIFDAVKDTVLAGFMMTMTTDLSKETSDSSIKKCQI